MKTFLHLFTFFGTSSLLSAALVAGYSSGVLAEAGATGASDPTTQGWTYSGSGSGYSDGYDSGNGGYRTVDGTSAGASWYEYDLNPANVSDIGAASGWELSWTSSVDGSALLEGGSGVTGYYLPPNQGRVSSVAMWFELTGQYTYILEFRTDSSGNLLINDGTTSHQITSSGGNNAYDSFYDYSLRFDGTQATLAVAGTPSATSPIAIASRTVDTGQNRILMGSYSNGNQGSVIWNEVELMAIPEPSVSLLTAIAVFGLVRRRR